MDHAKAEKLRRYKIALALNTLIWFLQSVILIFFANSLSLFGDAAHSASDSVILLGSCIIFARELSRPEHAHETMKRTFTRFAIFLLWGSACYVAYEAVERITNPVMFLGWPVVVIACVSAIGNFFAHRIICGVETDSHDHLHRANVLHILSDMMLSIAVLCSALGVIFFHFPALDGWIALLVSCWMIIRGGQLYRDTANTKHTHDAHDHCTHKH